MSKVDLHVHSTFSDGKNSPEEIILSAINMGLDQIGISDHSFTQFDQSYCIPKTMISEYKKSIYTLKDKYKEDISVLLGIEQDYYSDEPTDDYDYVIGSLHYIMVEGEYVPVDESAEILINATKKYFNGNIYDLIDVYFQTIGDIINKTDADIIGHIDLIAKFNEQNNLFDEKNDRYISAYKSACDKLLATGKVFEINTGAISRGYRTTPYPSSDIYMYLKSNGAKFVLSSDSHSKDTLCYDFDKYKNLVL